MLVAPLMTPVTGLGLGIVNGDSRLLATSMSGVLRGSMLVVVIGLLTAELLPGATLTAEAEARGDPTLLDLGVAAADGAAGAYALSRASVAAVLPGVAIAVALVPPLAAIGIGVALADWGLAGGAVLLFAANLVAIAAVSGLIFFWLGFRPETGRTLRLRVFHRGFTALLLLVIAIGVPLVLLAEDSITEASTRSQVARALDQELAQLPAVTWADLTLEEIDGLLEVGSRSNPAFRLTSPTWNSSRRDSPTGSIAICELSCARFK